MNTAQKMLPGGELLFQQSDCEYIIVLERALVTAVTFCAIDLR